MPPFRKNAQMCHQNGFTVFSEKLLFLKILWNKQMNYVPKYHSSNTLHAPGIF